MPNHGIFVKKIILITSTCVKEYSYQDKFPQQEKLLEVSDNADYFWYSEIFSNSSFGI